MKTYQDVINEFFVQLKQIPIENRDIQLISIVEKLQASNLEVAKRILEQLNYGNIQIEQEVNKLLNVGNIAVNDYQSLSNLYQLHQYHHEEVQLFRRASCIMLLISHC